MYAQCLPPKMTGSRDLWKVRQSFSGFSIDRRRGVLYCHCGRRLGHESSPKSRILSYHENLATCGYSDMIKKLLKGLDMRESSRYSWITESCLEGLQSIEDIHLLISLLWMKAGSGTLISMIIEVGYPLQFLSSSLLRILCRGYNNLLLGHK